MRGLEGRKLKVRLEAAIVDNSCFENDLNDLFVIIIGHLDLF